MLMLPPSEIPKTAARSEPAASITARTSSIRCSSVGNSTTRSDIPVPVVEKDQTRERSETPIERSKTGFLPGVPNVRYPAGYKYKVDWSIPDYLVGDACLAAPRVARFWDQRAFTRTLWACSGRPLVRKVATAVRPSSSSRIGVRCY